jgi:hypothetical protein
MVVRLTLLKLQSEELNFNRLRRLVVIEQQPGLQLEQKSVQLKKQQLQRLEPIKRLIQLKT